ncbi:hypothetical protein, partial [Pseudoalteromonas luteoviolacea]|uniref:hypothetical protein n=1 Tax=Pseudoalteromonas luteoviolacea TaxID=43657 RepID=UPI000AF81B03
MQRTQIAGLILIGVVLVIGIVVKHTVKTNNDVIFAAISDYTEKGLWELPRKSKYFTYTYSEGSKLKAYAETSGWPGELESRIHMTPTQIC